MRESIQGCCQRRPTKARSGVVSALSLSLARRRIPIESRMRGHVKRPRVKRRGAGKRHTTALKLCICRVDTGENNTSCMHGGRQLSYYCKTYETT